MALNGNQEVLGHVGVFIPHNLGRLPDEFEGVNRDTATHGFFLAKIFKKRVYLVQSIRDEKLYVVKRVEGSDNPRYSYQYQHDFPPAFRISHDAGAVRRLPDGLLPDDRELRFEKLLWYQRFWDVGVGDVVWELYFEYNDGGTLANLRDKYHLEQERIQEPFIWHVTLQLCDALEWLHRGPGPYNDGYIWDPIYHRNLTMNNVMLKYPNPYGHRQRYEGPRMNDWWGNAFPDIVVCDFGESALASDDRAEIRKFGMFPLERRASGWEDIYALGCILRNLCMAHVPFPENDRYPENRRLVEGQRKDESRKWEHRPDSRRLDDVNAHRIPRAYSDALMRLLKEFEWPNQENEDIQEQGNKDNCVPTSDFVFNTLRASAILERAVTINPAYVPPGYFDTIDVSWTKPWAPMLYQVNYDSPRKFERTTRRISKSLRRDDFLYVGLEYTAPNMLKNMAEVPIPQPPH
ncbi:kinase-like domain-containing protein [Annulohypoxylon moriforme]|nr:kinase-like domain-containing protein [Annulohypoxylon moriforme]